MLNTVLTADEATISCDRALRIAHTDAEAVCRDLSIPSAARFFRYRIVALAAMAALGVGYDAAAADFVWLEGEQPTRVNCQPEPEGVGHPEFLSQRAWFRVGIDAGQVEREAPAEGVLVDYAFDAKTAGEYERLGSDRLRVRPRAV